MLTEIQKEIQNDWKRGALSDCVALDELLRITRHSLPDLHQAILDTDGDELTDAEALVILFNVLDKLAIKGQ